MDHASSGAPSRSIGTGSGTGPPADMEAGIGADIGTGMGAVIGADGGARLGGVGAMCGCRGRLAVHRSVHDLASLQYQRMSAQA